MNLIRKLLNEVDWLRSLGRKLWRLTASKLVISIVLFMVSQGFLLLAMLLPLKVVLLVASDGIPWYLKFLVDDESKDRFVILLAIGAVLCYGLFHLCGRFVQRLVGNGSSVVLSRAAKLHLFPNQHELARQGYERYVRVIGSGMIAFIGFLLGLLVNPTVFGGLLSVIGLEFIFIATAFQTNSRLSTWVRNKFESTPGPASGVLSGLNFLVAFVLLLAQFLSNKELSVIIALISIILARQVLQRCVAVVQDMGYLSNQRIRLAALFYTSRQHGLVSNRRQEEFIDFVRPERRAVWVSEVIEKITGVVPVDARSYWLDSGMPGVGCFDVLADNGRWMIKFFGVRHSVQASHEAELFASHPQDLPAALNYIGGYGEARGRFLVFEGHPLDPVGKRKWSRGWIRQMMNLWAVQPDACLMKTYRRTHTVLYESLDVLDFTEFEIAVHDQNEGNLLARFIDAWPEMRQKLASLPLVYNNPALRNPNFCGTDGEGNSFCRNWSNWTLQPIGCEPYLLRLGDRKLASLFESWQEIVGGSEGVTQQDLLFVARLALLERYLRRKNLRGGLIELDNMFRNFDAT